MQRHVARHHLRRCRRALRSLIHLPRTALGRAAAEIHRVLAPGAPLLAGFHAGDGEIHAEELLGQPVSVDATLFQPDEMASALAAAGFAIDRVLTRPPVESEYPSTRAYVRAVA